MIPKFNWRAVLILFRQNLIWVLFTAISNCGLRNDLFFARSHPFFSIFYLDFFLPFLFGFSQVFLKFFFNLSFYIPFYLGHCCVSSATCADFFAMDRKKMIWNFISKFIMRRFTFLLNIWIFFVESAWLVDKMIPNMNWRSISTILIQMRWNKKMERPFFPIENTLYIYIFDRCTLIVCRDTIQNL